MPTAIRNFRKKTLYTLSATTLAQLEKNLDLFQAFLKEMMKPVNHQQRLVQRIINPPQRSRRRATRSVSRKTQLNKMSQAA